MVMDNMLWFFWKLDESAAKPRTTEKCKMDFDGSIGFGYSRGARGLIASWRPRSASVLAACIQAAYDEGKLASIGTLVG